MGAKWGRLDSSSPVFWRRYNTLRDEGFTHDEAALFAEGRISTPAMKRGRERRKAFKKKALALGLTPQEYEQAVDDLYDTEDWKTEYEQFYREEGEEEE